MLLIVLKGLLATWLILTLIVLKSSLAYKSLIVRVLIKR
jgi:hypothetical protein